MFVCLITGRLIHIEYCELCVVQDHAVIYEDRLKPSQNLCQIM